jgi:hypothetical protein
MRFNKPREPREQWDSPIQDYDILNIDTCKIIFNQSKDYFEETVTESEELTQRSTRMLFLIIPGVAAVVGYIISNKEKFVSFNNFRLMLLIGITTCLTNCVYNLITLIGPKKMHYRGSKPEDIMREQIFHLKNDVQIEKATYVSEIEAYEVKIEQMEFWNYERIILYLDFVYAFVVMVIIGIILLVLSIYQF